MSEQIGKFIWYDLTTSDPAAALAFYRGVFGWSGKDAGVPDKPYTILSVGEAGFGGIMSAPAAAPGQPNQLGWNGYIGVPDVDATAKHIEVLGGGICGAPWDVPGVARMAVVADPYGAKFMLMHGFSTQAPYQAPAWTPGFVGWHELHAGDGRGAFAFYAALFGWSKVQAIDMGPMGVYQTFSTGTGSANGGMMTKMPQMPMPAWFYYVNVEAIDAAVERVTKGGGSVLMGPHQVPTGQWIAQCVDPQGAQFAMLAPKR